MVRCDPAAEAFLLSTIGRSRARKNISIITAIVFDKRLKIDISGFKWEIVGIKGGKWEFFKGLTFEDNRSIALTPKGA